MLFRDDTRDLRGAFPAFRTCSQCYLRIVCVDIFQALQPLYNIIPSWTSTQVSHTNWIWWFFGDERFLLHLAKDLYQTNTFRPGNMKELLSLKLTARLWKWAETQEERSLPLPTINFQVQSVSFIMNILRGPPLPNATVSSPTNGRPYQSRDYSTTVVSSFSGRVDFCGNYPWSKEPWIIGSSTSLPHPAD